MVPFVVALVTRARITAAMEEIFSEGLRLGAHFARPSLQQNVRGFPQNSNAGPQHQQTNRETENRIEPLGTSYSNSNRTGNDGDVRKRIPKIMNQNAAQIQIVPPAHQRQRNSAVDAKRSQRRPYHPALDHMDRRAQSLQRFVSEPQRKKHQHQRIGESRQRARAVITVRFFRIRRTLRPAHGQPGNTQRRHVRKIVHRIIQQRYGMPEKSADNFGDYQSQRGDHGPTEHRRL